MSLPIRMNEIAARITCQTEIEEKLLSTLLKKLDSSLFALLKLFGSDCATRCYDHALDCVYREKSSACLDQYEEWVEQCIEKRLRRPMTESEEVLVGELLNQITGTTEMLLAMAGAELVDEEEEEQEEEDEEEGGAKPPTGGPRPR
jgi:erythromycin esterase-like protein